MDDEKVIEVLANEQENRRSVQFDEALHHAITAIRERALIRRAWDKCTDVYAFDYALTDFFLDDNDTALKRLAGEE